MRIPESHREWLDLSPRAASLLERYGSWLVEEAIVAGGIGPDEVDRLWERHVLDSLLFDIALPSRDVSTMLDVGSGVGLPGIPLAIVRPDTHMTLLDRSGRRVALLRRAVRILGLDVAVVEGDVADWTSPVEAVISRASLPPDRLLPHLRRILQPNGVGIVAGSHVAEVHVEGYATHRIEATVLDHPVWLLMMAQT